MADERGRRDLILEAAQASLGELGYHGTKLHEIAARVGIRKASLFHYFASKDDLYRAVVERSLAETEDIVKDTLSIEAPALDKIRALTEAYVDLVAAHPDRAKILLRQSLGDVPIGYKTPDAERLLHAIADFLRAGQEARIFAPIDPLALVLGIVGLVAFLFTSAPHLVPSWQSDVFSRTSVEHIKRNVVRIVERCILPDVAWSETENKEAARCSARK